MTLKELQAILDIIEQWYGLPEGEDLETLKQDLILAMSQTKLETNE